MKNMRTRTKWTIDSAKKVASKYTKLEDFRANDRLALRWIYVHKHYNMLDHITDKRMMWTRESAKKEALKYGSRLVFYRNCPSAYKFAARRGLLNYVCEHMGPPKHSSVKRNYLTLEIVKAEALKYKTKKEFEMMNCSMFKWSYRNKVEDIVCAHMIRSRRKKFKHQSILPTNNELSKENIIKLMKERGVLISLRLNDTYRHSCVINSIIDPVFSIDSTMWVSLKNSDEIVLLSCILDSCEKRFYLKHKEYALPDRCLK